MTPEDPQKTLMDPQVIPKDPQKTRKDPQVTPKDPQKSPVAPWGSGPPPPPAAPPLGGGGPSPLRGQGTLLPLGNAAKLKFA